MVDTARSLVSKLCVAYARFSAVRLQDTDRAAARAEEFIAAENAVVEAIERPFAYAMKKIGGIRTVEIDGKLYSYGRTANARDGDDQYHFTVPGDERFSHPTLEGCLLGILKHASGAVFDRESCETHNRKD